MIVCYIVHCTFYIPINRFRALWYLIKSCVNLKFKRMLEQFVRNYIIAAESMIS